MERLLSLLQAGLYATLLDECSPPARVLYSAENEVSSVSELRACALFHCGRFEECERLLRDEAKDWTSRFNAAAASLESARSMHNTLSLRGAIAGRFRDLLESCDASQEEVGHFNLALALASGKDVSSAVMTLETFAKGLILMPGKRRKVADEDAEREGSVLLAKSEAVQLAVLWASWTDSEETPAAKQLLAACYALSGESEAAKILFDSVVSESSGMDFADFRSGASRSPMIAASAYYRAGEWVECVALIRKDFSFEAQKLVGCALLQLGQASDAAGAFRKSLEAQNSSSSDCDTLYNLFVAAHRAGRAPEEQLAVLQVLGASMMRESHPESLDWRRQTVDVFCRIGLLLLKAEKKDDDAIAAFEIAWEYGGGPLAALKAYVSCLMRKRHYSQARSLLTSCQNRSLLNLRIECSLRAGDSLDDVMDSLELWVSSDPANVNVLNNVALLMLSNHNYSKASALLIRGLKLKESLLPTYNYTLMLLSTGRTEEAVSLWMPFRKINVDDVAIRQSKLDSLPVPVSDGVMRLSPNMTEFDALQLDLLILSTAKERLKSKAHLQSILQMF